MRAAIYCRVSSERQEHEETIQSQLAELRVRAAADGLEGCPEFLDEGYSRDNLVRPRLDCLRDLASTGELDRVYVQCPDRLASGAKLMVLVEELQEHSVEVVFLKGSVDETPEGKLLLHMQGAIAEYERTKIAERTRRGKLYWARQGAVVGGHCPYGYRFVRRSETSRARLEVDEAQASIVRDMYSWLIDEEMSTRAIACRLTQLGVPTAGGARQWQPTVVSRILRNPAYHGRFLYQKSERFVSTNSRSLDPYRRNKKTAQRPRPAGEWITIPVPAIVDEGTWQQGQEQLRKNVLHSPRNNNRHQYLLRGLLRCPRCGATYTGGFRNGKRRYRCGRTDAALSSTGKKCSPGSFLAEPVEELVWDAIQQALQQPQVLMVEYQRRLVQTGSLNGMEAEGKQIALALKKVKAQEDRLTDAYLNEIIDIDRYRAEMAQLKQQRESLERAITELERRERRAQDSARTLEHLENFCRQVSKGLESLTFEERQKLLRLLVERVTVDNGRVRIETVIPVNDKKAQLRTHHPERSEESCECCPTPGGLFPPRQSRVFDHPPRSAAAACPTPKRRKWSSPETDSSPP